MAPFLTRVLLEERIAKIPKSAGKRAPDKKILNVRKELESEACLKCLQVNKKERRSTKTEHGRREHDHDGNHI